MIAQPEQKELALPPGFVWGVSTSGYQVEGHSHNSQWAAWEEAGGVKTGDRCGPACDWWHDAERDFDIARDIGVGALRLSVEWSRVEPRPGEWNRQALDRYGEMLQALRDRGIEPWVCLHHFSEPRWFSEGGGFLSKDAAAAFEGVARKVTSALGGLCKRWLTFNEPNVFASMGWMVGEFPPGRKRRLRAQARVLASMARAHVRAYRAIHEIQPEAEVGWTQNLTVIAPVDPRSRGDRFLSRQVDRLFNEPWVRLFETGDAGRLFRILAGRVPEAPGTCDFVGMNVYGRQYVAFEPFSSEGMGGNLRVPANVPQGDPGTDGPLVESWPGAIAVAARRLRGLQRPLYILENGVADDNDRIRPWLICLAVREIHSLVREGVDLRGYFHWTLTDNFEWAQGWKLRFGLVALEPRTQARTMRGSGHLYGNIARANALSRPVVERYAPSALVEVFGEDP